jgi:uncharacterized protein with ParB-like and HNH nuclease domain
MKADSLRISKVFSSGGDVHYFFPYFQREYAWDRTNWQTLLNDVIGLYDVYSDEKPPEHFMGSLVVINDGTRNGTVPAFKVVDGQQRLTTISLILCVLANLTKENFPNLYKKIRKMITNPDEVDILQYKLLPTSKYGDREVYTAILREEKEIPICESKIPFAYQYFYQEIDTRIKQKKIEPERFFLVLTNCLQVVFIDLNQEERPYEIFESLNAKGRPLTQADLVRNYIAMKLPEARQPEIFDKYWSKIENLLQEKRLVGRSRLGELTAFLRHYLAYRSGVLCNEEHVYERFRDRIEKEFPTSARFETEVATLKRFAEYYDKMLRPDHEPDKKISFSISRLNTFEFSTGYPFLLAVYEDYFQTRLTKDLFLEGLQVLENYMVRRYIAGESTNFLNKVFPSLSKEIDLKQFIPSLKKALVAKNYPGDHRLCQELLVEGMYDRSIQTRSKTTLILETINVHLSDKKNSGAYTILSGEPTIEHIMPQTLDKTWETELGVNYQQIYRDYLHTLGNLTLVTSEWNSKLSNSTFSLKKPQLAFHGLLMNSDYFRGPIYQWNEQAIRDRAAYLSDLILEIWPALGEPPAPRTSPGLKPIAVVILGDRITVSTWRDVACQTTEMIIKVIDNFDEIAETMPAYLDREKFPIACRQLSNGWFMNTNLSAASIKTYCRNLIASAGLVEDDWRVEEE